MYVTIKLMNSFDYPFLLYFVYLWSLLWKTIDELIAYTKELIERPNKMASLSENAKLKAKDFSQGKFEKRFLEIIT